MPQGTLEVLLVSAKGLGNTDFFSGIDPYAIITCRTQTKKSSVVSGGSCPEWNETFLFSISGGFSDLRIKIMDKDTFTDDDLLGEAPIPLGPVFDEGSIPPMSYNLVKDQEYCGEIKVGLKFTSHQSSSRGGRFSDEEEEIGGWKQSSMD